jgi:ubiquinone biosynthesis protein
MQSKVGAAPLKGVPAAARLVAVLAVVCVYSARLALACLARRRGASYSELCGVYAASLCEALGPTFIKLGQILSARPDLLPAGAAAPLARLQDQVRPFESSLIPRIIEEAYGRPLGEVFGSFDLVPVSAASVAQVHRARLPDGRLVAVKIRRPGVVRTVENDLRILRFFARNLSRLPFMRVMPLNELVEDIGTPIRQQLDFAAEAENNALFRRHFTGTERVRFPELVESLCADGIIVMEFLEHLQKVNATHLSAAEHKSAALAGLHALYKMIFIDGFIHADMHPGNVFVREWGEFVILDTGLVARLSASEQQDFVNFFFGLVNNRGLECARIVFEGASYHAKGCDRAAFEEAMVELVAEHSALKSCEFEVARFVYQLVALQRRFRIRGSTKFMMTILSMVVFDGICKQLYPECDFQGEARGYLITARYRRGSSASVDGVVPTPRLAQPFSHPTQVPA